MDLDHKIDRANSLLDAIEEEKRAYKTIEDIPTENLVYIVRCYDIFTAMTIDLIDKGAWS